MFSYKTSAELKRYAKGQLLGRYGTFFVAELYYGIIFSGLLLFTSSQSSTMTGWGMLVSQLILFLTQLLSCLFEAGLAYMYLKTVTGQKIVAADIFYGFKQHANKIILLGFVLTLMDYVVSIPALVAAYQYSATQASSLIPFLAITAVAAEFFSFWIKILFAPLYFVVLDFPNLNVRETLQTSIRLMHGHKGRFFYIAISFLPLSLLCLLTCGIGFFWLIPYRGMTYANFYMDLTSQKKCED